MKKTTLKILVASTASMMMACILSAQGDVGVAFEEEPVSDFAEVAAVEELEEPAETVADPGVEVVVVPPAEGADADDDEAEAHKVKPIAEDGSLSKVDLELDNVPFLDAIRMVMSLSGANIIAPSTNTEGNVTANLSGVTWKDAIESLLVGRDLELRELPPKSGIWAIQPYTPNRPEPWVTETYKLQYVKANDASKMLQSLLGIAVDDKSKASPSGSQRRTSPGRRADEEIEKEDVTVAFRADGRIASVPESNMIIVSAPAKKQEEISSVLKQIDIPRKQVYVESKIVQLKSNDSQKIGLDWSMLDGFQVGVGEISRTYQKTIGRQTGHSGYSAAAEASRMGGDVGFTLPESPLVADANFPNGKEKTLTAGSVVLGDGRNSGSGGISTYMNSSARDKNVADVRTAVFRSSAISMILNMIENNEDAKLVSNPKLVVANEEKAVIDMSRKEPYVTVELKQDGTGTTSTYTYTTALAVVPGDNDDLPYIEEAFFTYGIKLAVTPRINNESNITVVIEPTISSLVDYYQPAGENSTRYPIIDAKRVKTIFSLPDGSTAVIGGLTETTEEEVATRVPFLGRIPVLGKYFFSSTKKVKSQIETIIFVTVGVVDGDRPENSLRMPEATRLAYNAINDDGSLKSDEQILREKAEREAAKKAERKARKEAKQKEIESGESMDVMGDEAVTIYEAAGTDEDPESKALEMGELLNPM